MSIRSGRSSGASSLPESLNCTGIEDINPKLLTDLFQENPSKLFKYLKKKYIKYNEKLEWYIAEKAESIEIVGLKTDEILHVLEAIACIRRYLDSASGLAEDEYDEKIKEIDKEYEELTEKYVKVSVEFKKRSDLLRVEAVSEAVNTENVQDSTGAEDKQINNGVLDSEAIAADLAREKGYESLLPYSVPSFSQANTTERKDVEETISGEKDLKDCSDLSLEIRDLAESKGKEERKTLFNNTSTVRTLNAASTPINTKHLRFSDVLDERTISVSKDASANDRAEIDEMPNNVVDGIYVGAGNGTRTSDSRRSSDTARRSNNFRSDDSWKYVEPKSNMLEELSLCEDLLAISQIVEQKVTASISDVEVIAMNTVDVKDLIRLKQDLEKKSSALPAECNQELKAEAVSGFKAASVWIAKVKAILHDRQLHIKSDLKNSKPIDLKPFQGHSNSETNCYEFFTTYELISSSYTDAHKAQFLFSNYLAVNIQCEVSHVKHNYKAMKEHIISRHGNVNTLLMHKKNSIRMLKMIYFKSSRQEKLSYTKSYMEVLDQLVSLIELNTEEYPSIRNDLLSYISVMELAKLLPEFLFRKFNTKYANDARKRKLHSLSGEDSFFILVEVLKLYLSELEHEEELFYVNEIEDKKSSYKTPVLNFDGFRENDSERPKREFSTEEYRGAPCIAHTSIMYKVRECRSGQCSDFLNMIPSDRESAAQEKKVCTLCLLYACKIRSSNKCLFSKVLPKHVACQACLKNGNELNVLLCSIHKNDSPEILESLRSFLPGCEKTTRIELF